MGFGVCPIFGIGDLKLEVSGDFKDLLKGIFVGLIGGYVFAFYRGCQKGLLFSSQFAKFLRKSGKSCISQ